MRIKYTLIGVVIRVLFSSIAVVLAGNLTPLGGPTDTGAQMYTLEQIYNRLDTGAAATKMDTFTEPSSGPGSTMHTLNEIMAQAPALDNTQGATPTHVLTGKPFWGLHSSAWATQTGAMPDNGAVVITPTTISQTIDEGYHDGTGYVEGDTDLVAGNIISGVSIFRIAGDPNVVDTSSGDAAARDILSDKVAWVDGSEVTGSMTDNSTTDYTPGTSEQTVAEGYHNGSGKVLGDADLAAGNIRSGVTLFGVTGKCYRLPATGQTTTHATGDDGYYGLGCLPTVEPFYGFYNFSRTNLPWSSSSGTGFADNSDGTVTDTLTGLIWLKDASCSELAGTDGDGKGDWGTALSAGSTWKAAVTMPSITTRQIGAVDSTCTPPSPQVGTSTAEKTDSQP